MILRTIAWKNEKQYVKIRLFMHIIIELMTIISMYYRIAPFNLDSSKISPPIISLNKKSTCTKRRDILVALTFLILDRISKSKMTVNSDAVTALSCSTLSLCVVKPLRNRNSGIRNKTSTQIRMYSSFLASTCLISSDESSSL